MAAAATDFDVCLIGATGFTGGLTAEYLTSAARPQGLRLALAGRSTEKLEALRARLLARYGGAWPAAVPQLVDTSDIDGLVQRSKVIINTAGPFLSSAPPVVAACAKHGRDYVDITGETPFVKQTIDRHDAEARASGALLVPMCGFDSIPSDLGTLRAVRRIKELFGEETVRVSCFATMRGSLSGGTLASGIEMEKQPDVFARMLDPFLLGGRPEGGARPEDADATDAAAVAEGAWAAPFMMASLNTRVVRRTSGLLGPSHGYAPAFGYSERMLVGDRETAERLAKPKPPVSKREAMRDAGRLPKPGEGPSREERAKSWFRFLLVAEAASGKRFVTSVSGGDPGYTETSKMVSEAALALLFDRPALPAQSGVLTPASAFGPVLERRLREAGVAFADEGEDVEGILAAAVAPRPRR